MLPFDLRKYERKKIWLTISHVAKATNPLCAGSQKHDDESMKSLEFNKYRYGVGLLFVATPVSGRFGAVEVDSMLEQQGKELILKKNLRLVPSTVATVAPCSQKLADSGVPGAE